MKIAIIGGSGVKDSPLTENKKWKTINTKLKAKRGTGIGHIFYQQLDEDTFFIPRHGHTTRYSPNVTQYGANLLAAKMLGTEAIIATSAVGGLAHTLTTKPGRAEPLQPGSLVIPNNFIDETGRDDNLYGEGIVIHANMRPPFAKELTKILYKVGEEFKGEKGFRNVHSSGVYVTIPGDRFGTAAEGRIRATYAQIVGMTACPEAAMAMQLGLPYAIAAFVVDMDSDANHEGGTLAVMQQMSEFVPSYMARVIEETKKIETPSLEKQLKGNIIPGSLSRITNKELRNTAQEMINKYC